MVAGSTITGNGQVLKTSVAILMQSLRFTPALSITSPAFMGNYQKTAAFIGHLADALCSPNAGEVHLIGRLGGGGGDTMAAS